MKSASLLASLVFVVGCSASDPTGPFTWTEVTPCPIPRFEASGVVVDNELWVMGGFLSSALDVTKRIDIYDPSADRWRLGPELPGAETHAGVVSLGAKDFVMVGGFAGNVLDRLTTAGVWRWSGADSVWTALPDLPSPRAAVFAALVGTALHAAGGLAVDGNTDSGEHDVLELSASAWSTASPLANPRNHGGGSASGGQFFAISGRHGWDEIAGDDAALDAFDPLTNSWAQRAPMPEPRSEIGSATVPLADGRLLTVGGSITGKQPSADVLLYDPRADHWSTLPSLPIPLKGVVAVRIGSKVIVTTGSPTSTDPTDKTYVGCCL